MHFLIVTKLIFYYDSIINTEVHCTVVGVTAGRAGTLLCRSRPGKTVSAAG